jgi:hypothetical protein
MGEQEDRIRQVLQRIAEVWQIDSRRVQWSTPGSHDSTGFDWWPGDFRVRVRAHQRADAEAGSEFKVIVRTDFLKDVDIESERFEQMAAMLSRFSSSTYAWVYPPKLFWQKFEPSESKPGLWFSSSGYISSDNIGWMPDLLANTCIVQPINAQIHAFTMHETLGSGAPDVTRPSALRDAGLDEILEIIAQVYGPLGQKPSRWAGTDEFEIFAERWAKSDYCFGFGDPNGMTLETPFGSDSALIRLLTDQKHPQLGQGLLATLQLPYASDALSIAREVAELNLLEATYWTGFPQLGCWHSASRADKEVPAFTLFVPNALYQAGLATQIAFWFMHRARWAREQSFPDLRDDTMADIFKRRFGDPKKD